MQSSVCVETSCSHSNTGKLSSDAQEHVHARLTASEAFSPQSIVKAILSNLIRSSLRTDGPCHNAARTKVEVIVAVAANILKEVRLHHPSEINTI